VGWGDERWAYWVLKKKKSPTGDGMVSLEGTKGGGRISIGAEMKKMYSPGWLGAGLKNWVERRERRKGEIYTAH